MKFMNVFIAMALMACSPAWAGFQGLNGSTDLGIFNKVKCSTGLTCTKVGDAFSIVSSPSISTGDLSITGAEAGDATLNMISDEGDDNADTWQLKAAASGNAFSILNKTSGSLVQKFALDTSGVITMSNLDTISNATDDSFIFASEDNDTTIQIKGFEAKNAVLQLWADEGDDNADKYSITSDASTNSFTIKNNATSLFTMSSAGNVTMVGTLAGHLAPQVAATATTITAAQCGSTFSNSGAVQMELPEASTVIGCTLTFVTLNASNFDINPDNADQILTQTNAVGDAIRNATVGNSIVLRAVSASQWATIAVNGTWTDIN